MEDEPEVLKEARLRRAGKSGTSELLAGMPRNEFHDLLSSLSACLSAPSPFSPLPPPPPQAPRLSIEAQAQIDALEVMTAMLFKLMAETQPDAVTWLDAVRQQMIDAVHGEDEAALQALRTAIDVQLSQIAAWKAQQQ